MDKNHKEHLDLYNKMCQNDILIEERKNGFRKLCLKIAQIMGMRPHVMELQWVPLILDVDLLLVKAKLDFELKFSFSCFA